MQLGEHTHTHTHTRTWESLTAGQQSAAPLLHPTATTQTLTVRVQTRTGTSSTQTRVAYAGDAVEETLPGWRSVCVSVCVEQQQQQQQQQQHHHSCNSPRIGSEAGGRAPSVGGVWVLQDNNPQLSRSTDTVLRKYSKIILSESKVALLKLLKSKVIFWLYAVNNTMSSI